MHTLLELSVAVRDAITVAGFHEGFLPGRLNSPYAEKPSHKPLSGGCRFQNIPQGPAYPAGVAGYIALGRI
ncbi:hypothetical protein [Rhodoferax koreensis]|uniref:hypothetical protein n=1 Tax=Rhodoferax koreensis TaxID=1842727 RepID=UPI0012FF9929|nr:hypothetical protein [Rhodoferax koreense]